MAYNLPKNTASSFGPVIMDVGASVASSLSAVVIPFVSGSPDGSFAGTVNVSNTSLFLVPIYIDQSRTYTKIGAKVTNAPGAGSTTDMVIYDNSGTGGLPGAVVASAVNLDSSASGIVEGTISAPLNIAYYWLGIQRNATAAVTIVAAGNGDGFSFLTNKAFINTASLSTSPFETFGYFSATNTYGTYPSNPTITQNQPSNNIPIIYLR